jgi:hypothetical protein
MDKMTRYRELIKKILKENVDISRRQPIPGVEKLLIADDENGHYIWMKLGWENRGRANWVVAHVRLQDGKFRIEDDMTEFGVANQLIEAGVPKEDIVLAFHHPEERQYTEFAAA